MGLDVNGTRFMLVAKRLGADFTRTAMIGRQGLHLSPAELRANLDAFRQRADPAALERMFADGGYAEEFLRHIGARDVDSFDKSDYEGSTHLLDLNEKIPESLRASYSVVLDGGSLEHVFNFPVALANCMEMVVPGGHYVGITPANNFMGHGFYQFSPELFLTVFRRVNGYELVRLYAFEDRPRAPWYEVQRPAVSTQRIMSIHSKPVYLLVMARRVELETPFLTMPQQSDYVAVWEGEAGASKPEPATAGGRSLKRRLLDLTPVAVKELAKTALGHRRRRRRFNPAFFKKRTFSQLIDSVSAIATERSRTD